MKTQIISGITKYYNDDMKQLMSYSRVSKPFTEDKFDKIPSFVLEKATMFGKNVSDMVLKAFSVGLETIKQELGSLYTKEQFECLKSIILKIQELKLKPKFIEKHIFNDNWHGYLDIDCENCFIEIKTRNNSVVELSTIVQCEIYKRITKKPYYIFQVNKKTGQMYCYKDIELQQIDIANKVIDAFEIIHKYL